MNVHFLKKMSSFFIIVFITLIITTAAAFASDLDSQLREAAKKGDTETVKLLLDKGADVNAGDKDGSTAILFATRGLHLDVIKLLLEYDADPDMRNKDKISAWAAVRLRLMYDKKTEIYPVILKLIESSRLNHLRSFLMTKRLPVSTIQKKATDSPFIVREMIEQLSSPDVKERESAAYNLKVMGKSALSAAPALMELVNEDNYSVPFEPKLPHGIAERMYQPSSEATLALVSLGDPDTIKPLLAIISSYKKRWLYQKTIEAIKNLRETAIEPLVKLLLDEKSNKKTILEVLNDIDVNWAGNEAVKQVILELAAVLDDFDSKKRRSAANSLNIIGKANADIFLEMLEEHNTFIKRVAATALQNSRDERIIVSLLYAMENQDYTTIQMMRGTLREFGTDIFRPLLSATKRGDPFIDRVLLGLYMTVANTESPSDTSLEFLLTILNSKDIKLSEGVLVSLGITGDLRIVKPIIDYLNSIPPEKMRRWEYFGIHDNAYRALAKVGEPVVLPLIGYLDYGNPFVRSIAVKALHEIADPRAVEPLFFSIKDENPKVRTSIASSFINWKRKDPMLLHPLIWILEMSKDPKMRIGAASALGRLEDKRAIEPLIRCLGSDDRSLKQSASAALRTITGKDFGDNQSLWRNYLNRERASGRLLDYEVE